MKRLPTAKEGGAKLPRCKMNDRGANTRVPPARDGEITGGLRFELATRSISATESPMGTGSHSEAAHLLRYRAKRHERLPHVVKFSGGRSSGMLLFSLLRSGVLEAERGDVVVFNNTSAEHPETYRFVRRCAEATRDAGIPFFWVEYQTYEDVRGGEWTRVESYRLTNDEPHSMQNPHGFHWRGEVFEELLSWRGYVPNQFSRICTVAMKLRTTRAFLADWLAGKDAIAREGHYGEKPRIDFDSLHRRHRRNGGRVPWDTFKRKRSFALQRPHVRAAQRYEDFSPGWRPFENAALSDKVFGDRADFAHGAEYVAFIGLRGDEQARVQRVWVRSEDNAPGYEGEHVYMPLADLGVTAHQVNDFWDRQPWTLDLPTALPGANPGDDPQPVSLSNCVFCFLKGGPNLRGVLEHLRETAGSELQGFGTLDNTPSDLAWWHRIENTYARDLKEERRPTVRPEVTHVGFLGSRGLLFESVMKQLAKRGGVVGGNETFSHAGLPCDCTD